MQRAILEKVAAHLANVAAHARVKRAYDRYLEKNAEPGIVDTAVTAFKDNPAAVGAGAGALLGGVLGGGSTAAANLFRKKEDRKSVFNNALLGIGGGGALGFAGGLGYSALRTPTGKDPKPPLTAKELETTRNEEVASIDPKTNKTPAQPAIDKSKKDIEAKKQFLTEADIVGGPAGLFLDATRPLMNLPTGNSVIDAARVHMRTQGEKNQTDKITDAMRPLMALPTMSPTVRTGTLGTGTLADITLANPKQPKFQPADLARLAVPPTGSLADIGLSLPIAAANAATAPTGSLSSFDAKTRAQLLDTADKLRPLMAVGRASSPGDDGLRLPQTSAVNKSLQTPNFTAAIDRDLDLKKNQLVVQEQRKAITQNQQNDVKVEREFAKDKDNNPINQFPISGKAQATVSILAGIAGAGRGEYVDNYNKLKSAYQAHKTSPTTAPFNVALDKLVEQLPKGTTPETQQQLVERALRTVAREATINRVTEPIGGLFSGLTGQTGTKTFTPDADFVPPLTPSQIAKMESQALSEIRAAANTQMQKDMIMTNSWETPKPHETWAREKRDKAITQGMEAWRKRIQPDAQVRQAQNTVKGVTFNPLEAVTMATQAADSKQGLVPWLFGKVLGRRMRRIGVGASLLPGLDATHNYFLGEPARKKLLEALAASANTYDPAGEVNTLRGGLTSWQARARARGLSDDAKAEVLPPK